LIQNTQNRDGLAIQTKLDELVRTLETANNRFVGIEKLPEEELENSARTVSARPWRRGRRRMASAADAPLRSGGEGSSS
jgi:low affinity Fe/Cu permease